MIFWIFVILCILSFPISIFLFAVPWGGVDENIVYCVGDEYCVVEIVEHRLFKDREYSEIYKVIEVDGRYFYEDPISSSFTKWEEIEVDE